MKGGELLGDRSESRIVEFVRQQLPNSLVPFLDRIPIFNVHASSRDVIAPKVGPFDIIIVHQAMNQSKVWVLSCPVVACLCGFGCGRLPFKFSIFYGLFSFLHSCPEIIDIYLVLYWVIVQPLKYLFKFPGFWSRSLCTSLVGGLGFCLPSSLDFLAILCRIRFQHRRSQCCPWMCSNVEQLVTTFILQATTHNNKRSQSIVFPAEKCLCCTNHSCILLNASSMDGIAIGALAGTGEDENGAARTCSGRRG
mmetsp:Transcript_97416/g.280343  ORF Transcript_97416/g.280343 Transcript_97416/m.280343 type:complete len:251 (+) Transcript_97416:565-1317(+)